MPLEHSKSKEAFSHNIKAEMKSGKPQKQAVAIAYSVKKRALTGKKKRKYDELEDRSKKAGFYVHGHKNFGDVYEE